MELIVVTILIGIFAGFGLSQYQKTIQITRERDARTMLLLIKTGQNIFKSKNGEYFPKSLDVDPKFIAEINEALGLNIIENPDSVFYVCEPQGGANFYCRADYEEGVTLKWRYRIRETDDIPDCVSFNGGQCYL